MFSLPESAQWVLVSFAPLFSKPVWEHVQVLVTGALLCRGPHTVASVLRTLGLSGKRTFCNYHRVLSRARWSELQGAKILLGLLVVGVVAAGYPLVIGIDETLERRKGKRIKAKGRYRDAVRSTQNRVVTCYGLKWICLMLIVPLPWSPRPWALPFLTMLAPSAQADEEAGRRHKTVVDWTIQAVKQVSRWLRPAAFILVGDGAYACVALAQACLACEVTLVSRLRLDARLYAFPEPQPRGKRGRKPKKGARLPTLKELTTDASQPWRDTEVAWYEGAWKHVRLLSGVCLWHTPGEDPVRLRWVLVVDPEGETQPQAFFSTHIELTPERIVEVFVERKCGGHFRGDPAAPGRGNPAAMVGSGDCPDHPGVDGTVFAGLPHGVAPGGEWFSARAAGGLVQKRRCDIFRCLGVRPPRHLGTEVFRQLQARQRPDRIIPP